jgi:multidrug efflux pump subunit AcrB
MSCWLSRSVFAPLRFVGAIIGAIFRRQIVLQVLLSILTSSSVVLYLIAREGWLSSKYSLQEKIDGLQEVVGVYVLFCVAPTVLASIFVARWFLRRQTI